MSSIGSNPPLNPAGLDRLGGQVVTDGLLQPRDVASTGSPEHSQVPASPQVDAGERMLAAAAWDGQASRMLSGDLALEAELGGLDLAQAADRAADAVLGALTLSD